MPATDNEGSEWMHAHEEMENRGKKQQNGTEWIWVSVRVNDWMNRKYHTDIQIHIFYWWWRFPLATSSFVFISHCRSLTCRWTDVVCCVPATCVRAAALFVCVCVPIINMKISSHYHYYWHIFWIAFAIKLQFCLIFHRIRSIQCSSHTAIGFDEYFMQQLLMCVRACVCVREYFRCIKPFIVTSSIYNILCEWGQVIFNIKSKIQYAAAAAVAVAWRNHIQSILLVLSPKRIANKTNIVMMKWQPRQQQQQRWRQTAMATRIEKMMEANSMWIVCDCVCV